MTENLDMKEHAFEHGASAWTTWNATWVASGTAITNSTMWAGWNTLYSYTTSSTSSGYTMMVHPASGQRVAVGQTPWVTWNEAYQETEDERAEREQRQAELRAGQEAAAALRRQEREEARARSEALLRSLLSEEQRATLGAHGWFEVRGSAGGRWRIRCSGQSGNVDLMPEHGDARDATYCAHPPGLPDADAWIAQMLALVTDEGRFTEVANLHWRRQGFAPRAERRMEAVPGLYGDNPAEIRLEGWLRPAA
jgi:hypothetical protein